MADWNESYGFAYRWFNGIEAAIWFAIAGSVLIWGRSAPRRLRYAFAGCLVLFGLTDIVEARNGVGLTPELWWAKLLIGLALFILFNAWERHRNPVVMRKRLPARIIGGFVLVGIFIYLYPAAQ